MRPSNSGQESTFAHLKRFHNLFPNLTGAHLENVTLWSFNSLENWIRAKPDAERIDLLTEARKLEKQSNNLSEEHKARKSFDFEKSMELMLEEHKKAEQEVRSNLSILRVNKELVPTKSESLDKCR